ncbi:MAG: phospholipid carrier-dependent glycosyltransferase [Anaerolineales bacterium]
MSRIPLFSLLLLISLAAGLAIWYVTPAGLGLTNDSAAYIGGARSLLAGTGYSDIWLDSKLEAVTHYPPLLSLILGGLGLLGLDPYRGARVLNILLFAASTGLVGILGYRMTKSQAAGIVLALLFGTNAQLLRIHAQVLSEPLFIFFSLASFLTFSIAIKHQSAPKTNPGKLNTALRLRYPSVQGWKLNTEHWLLLTGLLTGLAFLTRYSALALIATFLIAIFLLSTSSRFKRIAVFLAGAIPPIAAWFIRNSLVADSATNRVIQYNPIQISNVRTGLWNVADFLTPVQGMQEWLFRSGSLSAFLIAVGMVLFAWLAYQAYRSFFLNPSANPLTFTTALYVFGYLGAVLFSMSFFDASTKFQHRILSPLYVSWMVLLVYFLQILNTKDTTPALAGGAREGTKEEQEKSAPLRFIRQIRVLFALTLVAFVLALSTFNFQQSLTELREIDGLGYASWRWRQAEVLTIIRDLPPDVAIYSNSPPAIYHVTGRASRVIPTPKNPASRLPRDGYDQSLAEMREELLAGRAVLALFNVSDIEDAFGGEIALQFDDLTLLVKAQGHVLYGMP